MKTSSSAGDSRQRRYRQRQRRRQAVYGVTAGDEVLTALLVSTRLTDDQALDRDAVARALGSVIADWAKQWR